MKVQYIVPRASNSEITIAVVNAQFSNSDLSSQSFVEKLDIALSSWFAETKEGKTAWEESCGDFNIGDLAMINFEETSTLLSRLEKVGISNLEIDTYVNDPHNWTYDIVLGDG